MGDGENVNLSEAKLPPKMEKKFTLNHLAFANTLMTSEQSNGEDKDFGRALVESFFSRVVQGPVGFVRTRNVAGNSRHAYLYFLFKIDAFLTGTEGYSSNNDASKLQDHQREE